MARGGEPFLLLTGPLFIGSLFNWSLLGTLVIQTYIYYSSGFKDSKWIKGLGWRTAIPRQIFTDTFAVIVTLSLDIVQTVFTIHAVWQILILGWGNPATFVELPWTAYTFPVMSGAVAALVQFFFSWRIWVLGRNKIAYVVAIVIDLVAVMQMVSGLVAGIQTAYIPIERVGELTPQFTASNIWLAGSFSADVIIVVSMLWILHVNKGGIAATDGLIDRLMVRVIHSGAITAVAAGVELILYKRLSSTFVHDTPALFLGKLYSNVLLANLNTRRRTDNTYSTQVISGSGTSDHPMSAFHINRRSGLQSTSTGTETQILHPRGSDVKISTTVLSDPV
ncbi:hypothetical protein MSAN_00979100 [Mycena sanguinolenta]|uniref:DUF6534 domain-containing protein n=1 Tax=Mycena sanguinolenta TaxID=230812 RepID=A0A8H6YZM1_9AGAR|nr:hypothetical protein MSAN_00979100 [Mycena sanguinolenta]